MRYTLVFLLILTAVFGAGQQPAMAYVGPGLGLGAIGAILGVVLSVLLAVFAIVWYPVKRLLGLDKRKQVRQAVKPEDQ